ncbi:MAG: hypothetical protein V1793_21040 [Pseudomonadota bacterium]
MNLSVRLIIIPLILATAGFQFFTIKMSDSPVNPSCPWCIDQNQDKADVAFIPIETSFVRLAAPADPDLLADILWMRSTYYFGKHVLSDRQYPFLLCLLDIITDLSPEWKEPYLLGAVLLPVEVGLINDGLYLIDKGLGYFSNDWRLWFFKGYYLWKGIGNTLEGAKAIHRAALLPGAPVFLSKLSATLADKSDQKQLARQFLEESLSSVKTLGDRQKIIEKMKEMHFDE